MFLPVYIYGHPALGRPSADISQGEEGFDDFLRDMWETMYEADGLGLAAPQVGRNIRLFVIDASVLAEDYPACEGFKRVFINARITERSRERVVMNEGCLSIPGIHEDVSRPERVTIAYKDENWVDRVEHLEGMLARVVQHEYDHIEGHTFIDHLSTLKKRVLKKKLAALSRGNFQRNYRVVLPASRAGRVPGKGGK
ncbi:MAG: peptide deformylase [Odoribacteraceae bacterium]|jgi:peptide deformylase|nr:peptide deformylase [Odoribacteraceae bacterium]